MKRRLIIGLGLLGILATLLLTPAVCGEACDGNSSTQETSLGHEVLVCENENITFYMLPEESEEEVSSGPCP